MDDLTGGLCAITFVFGAMGVMRFLGWAFESDDESSKAFGAGTPPEEPPVGFEASQSFVGRAVVEVVSPTKATSRWVVGSGPEFVAALPSVERRPSGWSELTLGDAGFDARFRLFVRTASASALLREAFSEDVRNALLDLPGANLRGSGRSLVMRWSNHDRDEARVERAIEILGRIASAGLGPFEAAERIPGAEVRWPAGTSDDRPAPDARMPAGATVGRLSFGLHQWRLVGPFDGRWPAFRATVGAGQAGEDWPAQVLRDLGMPVETLEDAEVVGDDQQIEIRFARPPERAALEAGLRLIARAAAPPPTGAFR